MIKKCIVAIPLIFLSGSLIANTLTTTVTFKGNYNPTDVAHWANQISENLSSNIVSNMIDKQTIVNYQFASNQVTFTFSTTYNPPVPPPPQQTSISIHNDSLTSFTAYGVNIDGTKFQRNFLVTQGGSANLQAVSILKINFGGIITRHYTVPMPDSNLLYLECTGSLLGLGCKCNWIKQMI